ncbi:MAG: glycosyltransferase family 4 protein [Campylobacterota bacterium]|nr:glycosyltransferase family 4 protein [Campylobacterota bacterium]
MRYKIAIVLNSAWQAYNFRLNLARSFKQNGYEVVLIAPYDEKYSELIKKEFEFYDVNIDAKGINPISDLKTMIALYRLYKTLNLDIVLNFTIKPNIYSSIVSGVLGIKSISNITGLGTIFIKQSIVTKIAKLLYKTALGFNSKVFFQNNDDKNLFVENKLVSKEKTDLLPGSGVDLDKFISIKKEDDGVFRFLLIARLLKDKGILEYIEAAKIIENLELKIDNYSDVEFQILGAVGVANKTAISKDELQQWVDDDLVNYLGTTDNVQEVIAQSDCVVLPSYREGTPRSLLEACAMEKPIIATDVVGCKEVVDDGINGYLCEVRNAQDLADKMETMISLSEEEREVMGKAGREKIVKEFDEKIVIDKYLESIKEILE